MTATAEARSYYGVDETNPLVSPDVYHERVSGVHMSLADVAAQGGKITRLRILSDGYRSRADVSYCHATLPDGQIVHVYGAPYGFWMRSLKGELVEWAKREGVYAKGIGLLDESNWSVLR